MRIKTFLLTSAVGVGVAFAVAQFAPEAYAQKGTMLQAQTQWAVSKVGDADAKGRYCAVARRFERNTVLTIAQNPREETSFALDFQRFTFDPTRSMHVTLDPGAGEQRGYDIKPLSAKAFVVKLGQDDAFFRALSKTGLLRVEAGNQSYVFNVSDVDVGQRRLETCLDSFGPRDAGANGGSMDTAKVEMVQELQNRVRVLEIQNEALLVKARNSDKADVQAPDVSAMAGKIDVLRSENKRLKMALRDQELAGKQNDVLAQQIKSLRNSNAVLQEQLKDGKPDRVEREYAKRIAAIKADNVALQKKVRALLDGREKSAQVVQEMAALKVKNDALNEKLAAVKAEAEAYQGSEIDRLSAENNILKAQLGDYKEMVVLVDTLRERVKSLETQNAALRDSVKHSDGMRVKVSALQEKVVLLTKRNEVLKKNAAKSNDSVLKAAQQKSSEALDHLRSQLNDMTGRNAALEDELAAMRADAKASDTAEMLQQEYKALVNALRQENDILKGRIDSMRVAQVDVNEDSAVRSEADILALVDRDEFEKRVAEIEAAAGDDSFEVAQLLDEDLNEAQRYERLLRENLESDISIEQPVRDDDFEIDDIVEENIEVRASEDPFEGFGEIEQPDPFQEPDIALESVMDDAVEDVVEELPEIVDAPAPAPAPVPQNKPEIAAVPVEQKMILPGFANVLESAGVVAASAVEKVDMVEAMDFAAYQWKAEQVFGSGEQQMMADAADFDDAVKAYLNKTQSRCEGDFAIIPDASKDVSGMRVDSYEIACVGAGISSAASIVFYHSEGVFTAIAHEIDAANLDQAMQMRDKVFAALTESAKS